MRGHRDNYCEILSSVERDGQYFATARIVRDGVTTTFEFGVSQSGHFALRRALDTKPFGLPAGVPHSYYFIPSYGATDQERTVFEFKFRVQSGLDGRDFWVKGPKDLLANLIWFHELKSLDDASHLRRVDSAPDLES